MKKVTKIINTINKVIRNLTKINITKIINKVNKIINKMKIIKYRNNPNQ